MNYWLAPNQEFSLFTGCRRTGRVKTFFQMPRNEWSCPDRLGARPSIAGRYVPGLGDAYDDAVARGDQRIFGWYYEDGERKPMYYIDETSAAAQEQLQTPEAQALIRKTREVRQYQQATILQLSAAQQAQIRQLMADGTYRTVQEALDHVRAEAGLPPLDYSDAAVQQFLAAIESSVSSSNWVPWVVGGVAVLLVGGAAVYYFLR